MSWGNPYAMNAANYMGVNTHPQSMGDGVNQFNLAAAAVGYAQQQGQFQHMAQYQQTPQQQFSQQLPLQNQFGVYQGINQAQQLQPQQVQPQPYAGSWQSGGNNARAQGGMGNQSFQEVVGPPGTETAQLEANKAGKGEPSDGQLFNYEDKIKTASIQRPTGAGWPLPRSSKKKLDPVSKGKLKQGNTWNRCPICREMVQLEDWASHAALHSVDNQTKELNMETSQDSGNKSVNTAEVDYMFIQDLVKDAKNRPEQIPPFSCGLCGVEGMFTDEMLAHIQGAEHMHEVYRWISLPSSPGHSRYKVYVPDVPIKDRHLKFHFCEVCLKVSGWREFQVLTHLSSKQHSKTMRKTREDIDWLEKGNAIRGEMSPPVHKSRQGPSQQYDGHRPSSDRPRPPPHSSDRPRPPPHSSDKPRPPPHSSDRPRLPPHSSDRPRLPPQSPGRQRPPPQSPGRQRTLSQSYDKQSVPQPYNREAPPSQSYDNQRLLQSYDMEAPHFQPYDSEAPSLQSYDRLAPSSQRPLHQYSTPPSKQDGQRKNLGVPQYSTMARKGPALSTSALPSPKALAKHQSVTDARLPQPLPQPRSLQSAPQRPPVADLYGSHYSRQQGDFPDAMDPLIARKTDLPITRNFEIENFAESQLPLPKGGQRFGRHESLPHVDRESRRLPIQSEPSDYHFQQGPDGQSLAVRNRSRLQEIVHSIRSASAVANEGLPPPKASHTRNAPHASHGQPSNAERELARSKAAVLAMLKNPEIPNRERGSGYLGGIKPSAERKEFRQDVSPYLDERYRHSPSRVSSTDKSKRRSNLDQEMELFELQTSNHNRKSSGWDHFDAKERKTSPTRKLDSQDGEKKGNFQRKEVSPAVPQRKRLVPRSLDTEAREILTKRIEATWQKYYHKYYSCVATNPEIVLEMQKEYLRSYREFFEEDPNFEHYYVKVAKPEDLREGLTLRIDRGSPGPDPFERGVNSKTDSEQKNRFKEASEAQPLDDRFQTQTYAPKSVRSSPPLRTFAPRQRPPLRRSRSPGGRSQSLHRRSRTPNKRLPSPARRLRSRSPHRRLKSPNRQSKSPHRQSKSHHRLKSPHRRSKSPRRRSKSPRRRSKSPRRRSKSPHRRSKSPHRRSKSPRHRSKSPRRRSRSPRRRPSPRRRSRSPFRTSTHRRSRSPSRRSKSPHGRFSSPGRLGQIRRSLKSQTRHDPPARKRFTNLSAHNRTDSQSEIVELASSSPSSVNDESSKDVTSTADIAGNQLATVSMRKNDLWPSAPSNGKAVLASNAADNFKEKIPDHVTEIAKQLLESASKMATANKINSSLQPPVSSTPPFTTSATPMTNIFSNVTKPSSTNLVSVTLASPSNKNQYSPKNIVDEIIVLSESGDEDSPKPATTPHLDQDAKDSKIPDHVLKSDRISPARKINTTVTSFPVKEQRLTSEEQSVNVKANTSTVEDRFQSRSPVVINYSENEPLITSTTHNYITTKPTSNKNEDNSKSKSVLGRLGPRRENADKRSAREKKGESSQRIKYHPKYGKRMYGGADASKHQAESRRSISARLGPASNTSSRSKSPTPVAMEEMFSDPFLGFVHKTLTGIILIGQYQKALATSSAPKDLISKINKEQTDMHSRMLTDDGHLLIQLARCCLEDPHNIETTFSQVSKDIGPILRNLDKQVVTLIADTPIIIE